VLLAGSLDAPYVYAGNDLPADSARIPPGHPYSVALVSVPGTQAADDAVLLSRLLGQDKPHSKGRI